eukprot:gene25242-30484_t
MVLVSRSSSFVLFLIVLDLLLYANALPKWNGISSIIRLRGGSSVASKEENNGKSTASSCTVLVSTSIGSSFLDKKKKVVLERNATVFQLKQFLQQKFPGSPPLALQNLYFGTKRLNDTEILSNVTSLPTIPLVLDMVAGSSVYNKTLSVRQAIEAYVSTLVQLSYLHTQMAYTLTAGDSNITRTMLSPLLREMFLKVNQSVYSAYAGEIAQALVQEQDPEIDAADTRAWRSAQKATQSPLMAALAKEFDLNRQGVMSYVYFSVLLLVFAKFGTVSAQNAFTIMCVIPCMWVSKLRQLRLLYKIVLNLVLPLLPYLDIFMPLLPAPLQVIAEESRKRLSPGGSNTEESLDQEDSGEHEEEDDGEDQGEENDDSEEADDLE